MSFDLTVDGLETNTQQENLDILIAKLVAAFGVNLNTQTDSIMGQQANIVTELNTLNQQVLQSVWRSMDPNSATGISLDARRALTGSIRKGATSSSVSGNLVFSGPGTANVGDLIQNDGNQTQWELTDGPHTATGPYPESIPATFAAVDTGAILAQAGTTWSIVTVIPGIASPPFENSSDDANVGRDQETDPDFRARAQLEIYGQNQGPLNAISAVVSKVDGVTTVRTYHNPTVQPYDSDGIPFKAFNVVVETEPSTPGAALIQSIANAIFSGMGAGGQSYGTDYAGNTVTDEEGQPQPNIDFDAVTLKDVYINVTLDTTDTEEPVSDNLADVVADEILSVANTSLNGIGQDVLSYKIAGIVSDLAAAGEISGVVTVTVELSIVAVIGPYIDPVPISIRERPDFDSVNINVDVLP